MAVEGDFTVSSGNMVGSYRERTFHYQVVGWLKDDEIQSRKVRKAIYEKDLPHAENVYLKITKGNIPAGEAEYRYIYGPIFGKEQLSKMIREIYTYGSD